MGAPRGGRTLPPTPSRRDFLWSAGGGLGGVALTWLLAQDRATAQPQAAVPHFTSRARRVVQLFMNGGVSQPDTFDYKPELAKRHGQKFDPGGAAVEAVTSTPGQVMKSPFVFKQHGRCGRWVSSVLPHLAGCVDDLAFLMAVPS